MVIIAWDGGDITQVFYGDTFRKVLTVFITAAILKLIQCKETKFHLSK